MFVHTLIGNPNYRDVWKVIKQLGGLVSKSNQSPIDVDKLNWAFIVDKPFQPVDKFDNVDSSPLFVSPSETLLYLKVEIGEKCWLCILLQVTLGHAPDFESFQIIANYPSTCIDIQFLQCRVHNEQNDTGSDACC